MNNFMEIGVSQVKEQEKKRKMSKVTLTKLTFENYEKVLQLKPKESQKKFVEDWSTILAIAYIGASENMDGQLYVIAYENEPVGNALIGKGKVGKQEPVELQQYIYTYRIMGFFIDEKYQNLGIGKKALKLLIEKIKEYPDGDKLPVALEVKKNNEVAMKLYESFGFYDTGIRYEDDCAFVKLPD